MKDNISKAIIDDVKSVADKLSTDILSRSEYFQHGQFSSYQIYDGGRTWEDICIAAGLKTKKIEPVSDEEYFSRLKKAYEKLGRYPKVYERKKYKLNFSKRRYPTLCAFIRKAVSLGYVPNNFDDEKESSSAQPPLLISEPLSTGKRSIPAIPRETKRAKWKNIGIPGFPYAPHDELGVVGLFSILCSNGRIKWQILEMRSGKGIDITCYDEDKAKNIRVELKYTLSKASWNHRIEDLDYVVCWENHWPDFPKPVLELCKLCE